MTEVAQLTTVVCSLKDDCLETRNELDRTKGKLRKVKDVNKTLTAIFRLGEEDERQGVHGNVDIGGEGSHGGQAGTAFGPSVHQQNVGKCKQINTTWKNWDTWKGSSCFEVLFNLKNQMLVTKPPDPLQHMWPYGLLQQPLI